MLKTILSISGRPGLYQLLSNSKNMIIVGSLQDGRKLPVHARDRVVSLGDISVYTQNDEIPLEAVMIAIKNKENGNTCSIAPNSPQNVLRSYFAEVLPNYDEDRVHASDIKKIITWYNLLVNAKIDLQEQTSDENESNEITAEEK